MEALKKQLDLIPNLSGDKKLLIEEKAEKLKSQSHAEICIDFVNRGVIQLSVKPLKYPGAGRYELLRIAYQLFSENIPDQYRLVILL